MGKGKKESKKGSIAPVATDMLSSGEEPGVSPFLIYTITFVVAACSILYELLIAHTITLFAANTVIWYSMTIGCYLASMGIGAFLCDHFFNFKNTWRSLLRVELFLTIFGAVCVILINYAHMITGFLTKFQTNESIYLFFIPSLAIAVVIGLLSGFELPLLIRLGSQAEDSSRAVSRVLAADYFGSLVGAVSFPLFLLPHFNVYEIVFFTAGCNLIVALSIVWLTSRGWFLKWIRWEVFCGGALAAIMITGLWNVNSIEQYFLKKYYYYREIDGSWEDLIGSMEQFPEVDTHRSAYQRIDIVKGVHAPALERLLPYYTTKWKENPRYPKNTYLFINGDYQLHTSNDEFYHEYFAHVPIIGAGKVPRKVLILGAGDGMLAYELLKYEEIESITQVELDPVMVRLAQKDWRFWELNRDALRDLRVRVVIGDGYKYVRETEETYDAIYIDFPAAKDYNLIKLYSKEFYTFVKKKLNVGGFAVMDMPGAANFSFPDENFNQEIFPENIWFKIYPTLHAAGFGSIEPYISQMDWDNPKVWKYFDSKKIRFPGRDRLSPREIKEKEGRIKKRMLRSFIFQLQQSFIMVAPEEKFFGKTYRDYGINMHVINEARFHRAFTLSFPRSESLAEEPFNSIMKPTLPDMPFWYIRSPY